MDRIIRERECRQLTGLSRTTRWLLERRGLFPTRRRLTACSVGWLESELRAWMASRETRGRRPPTGAAVTAVQAGLAAPRRGDAVAQTPGNSEA
jgi:prophage regulatory protein